MKNQYGRLSIGAMIGIGSLAAVALIIASLVGTYYETYEYGAKTEQTIDAQYQDMESILAQYSLKVKEIAQVPGMMTEDLQKVISAGMTGRYGEDGSKAAFQWIQENYPGQVDASLYKQIQQAMEAGRDKFENAQRKFIDSKRAYQGKLNNNPLLAEGWWLQVAGYPKIDLENDYAIISSGHAKKAFKTKVDEAIELR